MNEKKVIKKVDTINKVKKTGNEVTNVKNNIVVEQIKVVNTIPEKKVDELNKVANIISEKKVDEANKVVNTISEKKAVEPNKEVNEPNKVGIKKWTKEEDEKLNKIANEYIEGNNKKGIKKHKKKMIDWLEVSTFMNRTKQECSNRFHNNLKLEEANQKRFKWKVDDDKKIIERKNKTKIVHNEIKTSKDVDIPCYISKKMGNRTPKEVVMRLKKLKSFKMVDFENKKVLKKIVNTEMLKEELRKIEDEDLKLIKSERDILRRRKEDILNNIK